MIWFENTSKGTSLIFVLAAFSSIHIPTSHRKQVCTKEWIAFDLSFGNFNLILDLCVLRGFLAQCLCKLERHNNMQNYATPYNIICICICFVFVFVFAFVFVLYCLVHTTLRGLWLLRNADAGLDKPAINLPVRLNTSVSEARNKPSCSSHCYFGGKKSRHVLLLSSVSD